MTSETVMMEIRSWKDEVEFPPVSRPIAKSELTVFFPLLQNLNEDQDSMDCQNDNNSIGSKERRSTEGWEPRITLLLRAADIEEAESGSENQR
jgi:hypothetical protein